MKIKFQHLAIALSVSALLAMSSAFADGWPASVAGDWQVIGNQSVGNLSISQSNTHGQCKPIRGTIYNSDRIEGFYCPGSGRIAFHRYINNSESIKQHWSGNLSQASQDRPLRMGGLFASSRHNGVGGSLGEYNFSAVQ
jgi:hypothetical protein